MEATAAIVALFESAVTCYKHVQIARRATGESKQSQTRLCCLRLSLLYWGHAVGMEPERSDEQLGQVMSAGEEDFALLRKTMAQLEAMMQKAYKECGPCPADLDQTNSDQDQLCRQLESFELSVDHNKTQKHTKNPNVDKQKVLDKLKSATHAMKWALEGKESVTELIDGITRDIDLLQELFPTDTADLQRLADALASQLVEQVEELKSFMRTPAMQTNHQNKSLLKALEEAKKRVDTAKQGGVVNNWGPNNQGMQWSDRDMTGGTFNFGGTRSHTTG